jgi:hypothetical protein
VKVYQFEKYDIGSDTSPVASRMATRQFIEAVGGKIIPGTEMDVDPGVIDGNGQAQIEIQPPR